EPAEEAPPPDAGADAGDPDADWPAEPAAGRHGEDDEAPAFAAQVAPLAADPPVRRAGRAARPAAPAPRGSRLATVLWILLFVAVAGVAGTAIGLRDLVMAKWPVTTAAYDLVGLAEP